MLRRRGLQENYWSTYQHSYTCLGFPGVALTPTYHPFSQDGNIQEAENRLMSRKAHCQKSCPDCGPGSGPHLLLTTEKHTKITSSKTHVLEILFWDLHHKLRQCNSVILKTNSLQSCRIYIKLAYTTQNKI